MTDKSRKCRVIFRARAFFATLGALLGAAALSAGGASAASLKVLYSFCQATNCADGEFPTAGLIATTSGGLYGTASSGGNANAGVAFMVSITGGHGILHAFQNNSLDGGAPHAPLFLDKSGNFFGTTSQGGPSLAGAVFERSASGVYKLLHGFKGTDGSEPGAGVIADSAGNLYGTTETGGANNNSGTIFRLTPSGTLTTLYSFCSLTGCADGQNPVSGLIGDATGNLYGTTLGGGENESGVVFKIRANGTGYTVLHSFTNGLDGGGPKSGLSLGADGNLYGTTAFNGANGNGGTVFKIARDGSSFMVLYSFCHLVNCADGETPNGGLILDGAGNLYGTTLSGGPNSNGTVFALTPSGTETVLYSFCHLVNCADGFNPMGNLVALSPGNLYGTTNKGGGTMSGGVVFQLTNTGFVPPGTAALVP